MSAINSAAGALKQYLERIDVVWRIALFGAVVVAALFAVEIGSALSWRQTLVDAKHEQTQPVTEVALGVIDHLADIRAAGVG
ncbi:MAG: hypothetical protein WBP72_11965 [Rhodocyclaceae bacterium]